MIKFNRGLVPYQQKKAPENNQGLIKPPDGFVCALSDGNAFQENKALLQGLAKVRNLHGVFTGTE